MNQFDIKSALIGALLAVVIALSVAAATGNRSSWEYKVITAKGHQDELSKTINNGIAEGWEFVSASGRTTRIGGLRC
jgi:hypothetical protein